MYFRLGFNVNIKKKKKVKMLLLWLLLQIVSFYKTLGIRDPLTRTLGSFIGEICGMCLKCVTLVWCVCEWIFIIWVIFEVLVVFGSFSAFWGYFCVRIMWFKMIFYDVSIINNLLFKISCEIFPYFYDVKYWYIDICLLDLSTRIMNHFVIILDLTISIMM